MTVRHAPVTAPADAPSAPYLYAFVIILVGVLTYANSLSSPLLFDDFASIVRNPQITDLSNWSAVLSPVADSPLAGRPLVNLSFALNYAIAGPSVEAIHAVNLALHLLCALLLLGLVRRTLEPKAIRRWWPWRPTTVAAAVALLWTVHPLNSEVVSYATQRSESMMAACYLLALYGAARSMAYGSSGRWAVVTVLATLVGTGCKETIATAPIMVVLFDRAFRFRSFGEAFQSRWRVYACLAATWAPLAWLVATGGQSFSAGFSSARISVFEYFLNQPPMITHYLSLAAWPKDLVLYYGWPRVVTLLDVWPSLAFITALFALTMVALFRSPRVGVLGGAVFLTLGPTSSFIPIATEVGAERRMYLALAALLILAVTAVAWLVKRWPAVRPISAVLLIAVASMFAALTVVRNREYASALTMAETVLERWPTANAHYLVGVELAAARRTSEAITHLQQAVTGYPPALYYLGQELFKTGRFDESVTALRRFIAAEPTVAAVHPAKMLTARALEAAGRPAEAINELQALLSGAVGNAEVHAMLANLYSAQQSFAEAVPHYIEYLKTQPRDGNAWTGLGIAHISQGHRAEAIVAFQNAVSAQPGNAQFAANLARAMER